MLSGFWGWFFVIVFVVAIFNADRLPELKEMINKMKNSSVSAIEKGKKTVEAKIASKKSKKSDK